MNVQTLATAYLDSREVFDAVDTLLDETQRAEIMAAVGEIMADRDAERIAASRAKFSTQFVDGTLPETIDDLHAACDMFGALLPAVTALKDSRGERGWKGHVVRLAVPGGSVKVTLTLS